MSWITRSSHVVRRLMTAVATLMRVLARLMSALAKVKERTGGLDGVEPLLHRGLPVAIAWPGALSDESECSDGQCSPAMPSERAPVRVPAATVHIVEQIRNTTAGTR